MPVIYVFNKETKLFAIMLVARCIYPLDDRTLIVRDDLCYEYRLYFDDYSQLHDFMMTLYKQNISYVYCNYDLVNSQDRSYDYPDDLEIDPYKEMEIYR